MQQLSASGTRWDDLIGGLLDLQAQVYFANVETQAQILANQLDVRAVKRPAELLMVFAPAFEFAGSTAVRVTNVGMGMDLQRLLINQASRTGNADRERAYMHALGAVTSAYEHGIFELFERVSGVSTVKELLVANARGVPIFVVDSRNLATVLPQLDIEPEARNIIIQAVLAGRLVFVPRENIPIGRWQGVGYILLDPDTGSFSYLLTGRLAGGATCGRGAVTTGLALDLQAGVPVGDHWGVFNADPFHTLELGVNDVLAGMTARDTEGLRPGAGIVMARVTAGRLPPLLAPRVVPLIAAGLVAASGTAVAEYAIIFTLVVVVTAVSLSGLGASLAASLESASQSVRNGAHSNLLDLLKPVAGQQLKNTYPTSQGVVDSQLPSVVETGLDIYEGAAGSATNTCSVVG